MGWCVGLLYLSFVLPLILHIRVGRDVLALGLRLFLWYFANGEDNDCDVEHGFVYGAVVALLMWTLPPLAVWRAAAAFYVLLLLLPVLVLGLGKQLLVRSAVPIPAKVCRMLLRARHLRVNADASQFQNVLELAKAQRDVISQCQSLAERSQIEVDYRKALAALAALAPAAAGGSSSSAAGAPRDGGRDSGSAGKQPNKWLPVLAGEGLGAAVKERHHAVTSRWSDVPAASGEGLTQQQQAMEWQQQQRMHLEDLLQLIELVLLEVPVLVGCNNPHCVFMGDQSEGSILQAVFWLQDGCLLQL